MIVIVEKAKDLDFSLIKFFEPEEFDDPDCVGSWEFMDATTIIMLNWLRKNTKWPIITHNKFGVRGCVCFQPTGHSPTSFHYIDNGAHACDFHFKSEASPRDQAREVVKSGFSGIGIYQDQWKWPGPDGKPILLPIGFHVDRRPNFQIWTKKDEEYIYLLR